MDDLVQQLRHHGYHAEADSIEGKQQTRPVVTTVSAFEPSEEADVAALVAALDRDVPEWGR
jgi:hypothetical protein